MRAFLENGDAGFFGTDWEVSAGRKTTRIGFCTKDSEGAEATEKSKGLGDLKPRGTGNNFCGERNYLANAGLVGSYGPGAKQLLGSWGNFASGFAK